MPNQVRFYIPPKLESKVGIVCSWYDEHFRDSSLVPSCSLPSLQLLEVFDYGDIEEFQQYFALLDVDSSGDLSKSEIKLLLKSLGIEVSTHRPVSL